MQYFTNTVIEVRPYGHTGKKCKIFSIFMLNDDSKIVDEKISYICSGASISKVL